MHPYTSDASDRKDAAWLAFVLAVASAPVLFAISESIGLAGWLVSAPTAPATYVGLLLLYDRYLWKRGLIFWRSLPPDLTGEWHGTLTPAEPVPGGDEQIPVRARIQQDRTRISIRMDFPKSHSESISAEVRTSETDRAGLTYLYRSSPVAGRADNDMGMHTGAAWLRLKGLTALDGDYYNSPPRLRAGHIELHRSDENGRVG